MRRGNDYTPERVASGFSSDAGYQDVKLSLPPKTCKRPSKIVILLIIALVLVLTSTIVLAVLLAQEKKNDTNESTIVNSTSYSLPTPTTTTSTTSYSPNNSTSLTINSEATSTSTALSSQTTPFSRTTTGQGSPESQECKFDLAFLIDESENIFDGPNAKQNFDLIKKAMRDAIKYLTVSMNDTRVGWGAFSRDILSHEYFFETSTSQQTLRDIDDILFSPGGSNAISAFQFARTSLFNTLLGYRKDTVRHPSLLILISNGNYGTWDQPVPAWQEAHRLLDMGIKIYAIAVAEDQSQIGFENLKNITGDPSRVLSMGSYDSLTQTFEEILDSHKCPPDPDSCHGDLVFVVDLSESLGSDQFEKLKSFLIDFVSNVFVVQQASLTRIAMLFYSDTTESCSFYLRTFNNNDDIINFLRRNLTYIYPGGTDTASALYSVLNNFYKEANGDRVCSPNVVVLLTDGGYSGMNPAYPAEELRDSGVVIVSIGIGSFVNTLELQKISGPTGQVYQFSDTDQLNRQFLDSLINTTCSAAAVPVLRTCEGYIDIVILVDANINLTSLQFQNVKYLLKYLTKSFSVGMRVALGTYEKTPVWQPTNENLQQYIDGLSQDSSQAELAKGLEKVYSVLSQNSGGRNASTNVIILTTQPFDATANASYWAQEIQDGSTRIYGIAAGDKSCMAAVKLLEITGGESDTVVCLPNLAQLLTQVCQSNSELKHIQELICPLPSSVSKRIGPPPATKTARKFLPS